jgi:hypothetical protein
MEEQYGAEQPFLWKKRINDESHNIVSGVISLDSLLAFLSPSWLGLLRMSKELAKAAHPKGLPPLND